MTPNAPTAKDRVMAGIGSTGLGVTPIDWDKVAEAEEFGAMAVSRRARNRGARMTKYGLTTAQLKVVEDSASRLVATLRRVKKPLQIGKTRFELSEQGKREIVAIQHL